MANWSDVRRIAMSLPGTTETSEPGKLAWSVDKKGIAWQRPLRKGDIASLGDDAPTGNILAVRTPDEGFKELLCATDPTVYFTTPHFNGYAAVLIKLEAATAKHLRHVLTEAWLCRASKRAVKAFLEKNPPPKAGRSRA